MSLLSSTVNDDEFLDENKENAPGRASSTTSAALGKVTNSGSQPHRRQWKLFSSSSDDALQQRSAGHQRLQSGDGIPLPQSGGGAPRLPLGSVISASPDRILLPLGSSPVFNARKGGLHDRNGDAHSSGSGALHPGNSGVKDPRLRDVEPLLAASPNILGGGSGGKVGSRGFHSKSGLPMGAIYFAYTPPNRCDLEILKCLPFNVLTLEPMI